MQIMSLGLPVPTAIANLLDNTDARVLLRHAKNAGEAMAAIKKYAGKAKPDYN